MNTASLTLSFCLPEWISDYTASLSPLPHLNDRMDFVIEAARLNVQHGTGGPFAAAVFELETGKLIALGVNRVVPQGLSMLHAEMVALSVAQRTLGTHDLGSLSSGSKKRDYELVTSTEPCAMCFGGIQWAGLRQVVSGATDEDARRIGFDEGAKVADWKAALEERGIHVIGEVQRAKAAQVLLDYHEQGGFIYNAGAL
jgi:tRNA(Arg) A34 adenosine deaminase TadA